MTDKTGSSSALTATTVFAGLTATATTAIFASLFGVAGNRSHSKYN